MKFKGVLLAVFCLMIGAAVAAQDKATDFSGTWELDAGRSKLGERARIEAITMTVGQTAKEIRIEGQVKRAAMPEGERRGGNGGGTGRGGGGAAGRGINGDGLQVYPLDGKETTVRQETPMGAVPVVLKAKWEKDGKLKLSSSRAFETPMGAMTITVRESWSLSADGKTLTVARVQETPRGSVSTELVFNRK